MRTQNRESVDPDGSGTNGKSDSRDIELLTVRHAAQRLALSRGMLYNLMERGDLAYVKIGRARRIPLSEVERLVRESLIPRRNCDAP